MARSIRYKHDFAIPVHPGEILEEILSAKGLSQSDLARHLGETYTKINEICRGRRGISAEMAMKLARAFRQSPAFWINLQKNWELSRVQEEKYASIKPISRVA